MKSDQYDECPLMCAAAAGRQISIISCGKMIMLYHNSNQSSHPETWCAGYILSVWPDKVLMWLQTNNMLMNHTFNIWSKGARARSMLLASLIIFFIIYWESFQRFWKWNTSLWQLRTPASWTACPEERTSSTATAGLWRTAPPATPAGGTSVWMECVR